MTTLITGILVVAIVAGLIGFTAGLVLQRKAGDAKARSYARNNVLRGGYLVFVASLALLLMAAGIGTGVQVLIAMSLLLALWELTVVKAQTKRNM